VARSLKPLFARLAIVSLARKRLPVKLSRPNNVISAADAVAAAASRATAKTVRFIFIASSPLNRRD
jgi:hypothetical protein